MYFNLNDWSFLFEVKHDVIYLFQLYGNIDINIYSDTYLSKSDTSRIV